ncbi:ABC transporter permease [Lichenihabitans sp. PAMC28606]|uniref:ABC transporter permease n=1 Tax=Lichenihabitans sp. PAMC28606 TaxID=2880932 RepID=UPI001D0B7C8D|nr:ABC transporter permease [Lichenihabitans sp. PAMC28606]UDL93732.1 ABC transporter permease [Lichenihabitans sp. PAMC28606]
MSLPATLSTVAAAPPRTIRFERTRLLFQTPTFLVGFVIVLFWIFCATIGQTLVDPLSDDILNSLTPPSADHWFGTDQLGRDMFARVIAGSRDILVVAPLATLLGIVGGTILGLIMGFFPGVVDDILSRIIEAVLALPLLILALVALTALGASNATVILSIGLAFTPQVARVVRSAVMSERHLDYVAAARLRGENAIYIMVAEILPNVLAPITVELTVRLGYSIFTVATLSFLGVGLQPPSPDWGLAISENYALIGGGYWWTVLFDAIAIASLVIAINLIADALHGVSE